ncbi:MAG: hypothetical protein ACI35Q_08495 [Marinilabiliaceae bacterium]
MFAIQAKELLNSIDGKDVARFSFDAEYLVKRWSPLIDSTLKEARPDVFSTSARRLAKNIEIFRIRLSCIIDEVERGKVDDAKMIEAIDCIQEWANHDRETIKLINSIMTGAGQAPFD